MPYILVLYAKQFLRDKTRYIWLSWKQISENGWLGVIRPKVHFAPEFSFNTYSYWGMVWRRGNILFLPFSTPSARKLWRFNTSLLHDQTFLSQLSTSLVEFIDLNSGSSNNPQTLWEETKCFIRRKCISFSSFRQKSRNSCINELERQIQALEQDLKNTNGRRKNYVQLNMS